MAIVNSCCGFISLRSGCFSFGIFTLIWYTLIVTGGSFHVYDSESTVSLLLVLSSVMIILSILCILGSVFLIVGLCVESRKLLIPWIVLISLTSAMDLVYATIMVINKSFPEESRDYSETLFLYVIDIAIVALNIYGIICVASQYREYLDGRGTAEYNFKNPHQSRLKKLLCPTRICSYLFPNCVSSGSLSPSSNWYHVSFKNDDNSNKMLSFKMGNSESACHLMVPQQSIVPEVSSGTSIDDFCENISLANQLTNEDIRRDDDYCRRNTKIDLNNEIRDDTYYCINSGYINNDHGCYAHE